jgi:hypothetical protein
MTKSRNFNQNPLGQVLLATLLFCFIFIALFAGLYKAGTAYILKERSRRATNLTALTGGAVYANGLQLVREANLVIMAYAIKDAAELAKKCAEDLEASPLGLIKLAYDLAKGDPNSRGEVQDIFDRAFGVDETGVYPLLIEGQAIATANENGLSVIPLYAYNYETATSAADIGVPNMALRFRYADEFLPEEEKSTYSLMHEGTRHYFSAGQVEPAGNPRSPSQMRVKDDSASDFAGWWVRKESSGNNDDGAGHNPVSFLSPFSDIKIVKDYLHKFKLDITDRDDPPCHTFSLLGMMNGRIGGEDKRFFQAGEVRVETDGLAGWDLNHPYDVYLTKVDIGAFPVLRDGLQMLNQVPGLGPILKSSDLLNGI